MAENEWYEAVKGRWWTSKLGNIGPGAGRNAKKLFFYMRNCPGERAGPFRDFEHAVKVIEMGVLKFKNFKPGE